jgi:hypothetical protein
MITGMGRKNGPRPVPLRYEKFSIELQANHTWTAQPGCKVFVADRGAVKFDVPRTWIVRPDSDSIKFRDRKPPKDNCVLAFSYLRIPAIDWSELPLYVLIQEVTKGNDRPDTGGRIRHMDEWGEIVQGCRFGVEYAWRQGRYIDPKEKRPALSRICIARRRTVQALLTMDFWEQYLERFGRVWDLVLETLELDEPIVDPSIGPRLM